MVYFDNCEYRLRGFNHIPVPDFSSFPGLSLPVHLHLAVLDPELGLPAAGRQVSNFSILCSSTGSAAISTLRRNRLLFVIVHLFSAFPCTSLLF